jgi:hypothetical protein
MQEEEGETSEEVDESEPRREARFTTDIFTRKDGSDPECPGDAHAPSCLGTPEEDRWWSPEPPQGNLRRGRGKGLVSYARAGPRASRKSDQSEDRLSSRGGGSQAGEGRHSTGGITEKETCPPQGHQAEEAQGEGSEIQGPRVGAGQAGRLVKRNAH